MRCFIAVTLPDEMQLAIGKLSDGMRTATDFLATKMTWQSSRNSHITLAFLGDISDASAAVALDVMRKVAGRIGTFSLKVGSPLVFPDDKSPRTIALRLAKDTDVLLSLHNALVNELNRRGFNVDTHAFNPHITLARIKSKENIMGIKRIVEARGQARFGVMGVAKIELIKSVLTPSGAIYEPVGVAELRETPVQKDAEE